MSHTCHWPNCTVEVPPAKWGCDKHWFRLPYKLRAELSKHYRRGQEVSKDPSPEYVEAAKRIREYANACHLQSLSPLPQMEVPRER
jgi:hypothetical protein